MSILELLSEVTAVIRNAKNGKLERTINPDNTVETKFIFNDEQQPLSESTIRLELDATELSALGLNVQSLPSSIQPDEMSVLSGFFDTHNFKFIEDEVYYLRPDSIRSDAKMHAISYAPKISKAYDEFQKTGKTLVI